MFAWVIWASSLLLWYMFDAIWVCVPVWLFIRFLSYCGILKPFPDVEQKITLRRIFDITLVLKAFLSLIRFVVGDIYVCNVLFALTWSFLTQIVPFDREVTRDRDRSWSGCA